MVVQEALGSFAEVNSATNKLKVLHLKILTFFTVFTANTVFFPSDPEAKQFGDHWFNLEQ